MCGIGGIINPEGISVRREDITLMSSFMLNRGPDNEGYWLADNVGLLHRRLSIIDLSKEGNQPMSDSEKTIIITFNGEIYNFPILKQQLISSGIFFHSSTDTETLIYGYKTWGIETLLNKIEGMFTFCIYDISNQKVYLCRDRFGKKPLYYSNQNERLVFASDIRSIAAVSNNLSIDYGSLDYYLTELSVPQPKTIWEQVKQIDPASYMEFDIRTGNSFIKEYWKLNYLEQIDISMEEAELRVEELLTKSIQKRTISDVPIGCFLSGGVDSGLIVALLAQQSNKKINTYTIGFKEEEFNELPYAKKVAQRYDTNHREILIKPNIKQDIESLVEYFGEPFADSSCIPTFYICREMKQHVTVALSGDGGDEMFGYPEYARLYKTDNFFERYPNKFQRNVLVNLSKITSRLNISENYGMIPKMYEQSQEGRMLMRGMAFMPEEKKMLYAQQLKGADPSFTSREMKKIWESYPSKNLSSHIFIASIKTRLLNDYLVKVDRASMKNSLEVRSPFLDHHLAEFSFKLPPSLKLKNGETKYILKKLAQKHVDENIMKRKKQGFGIPIKHWLKYELKEIVNDTLSEEAIKKRGFFNAGYVTGLINEHNNNKVDHTHKIWALLWLELWFRQIKK